MRGHRMTHGGWLPALITLAFIVLMLASPALSQQSADEGKLTAEQWCSACHLIDGHGTAIDGAPPFRTVARLTTSPAASPPGVRRRGAWDSRAAAPA